MMPDRMSDRGPGPDRAGRQPRAAWWRGRPAPSRWDDDATIVQSIALLVLLSLVLLAAVALWSSWRANDLAVGREQRLAANALDHLTGTERDRDTIRAWYTRADLLLFPSTFDTNGLVVREAAACSLGSVLIEGSCAAEGITDGDTGILIPENGDGLAAALLREGADRAYVARIGETASEKIYLSWEDSVKNARAQYRSVIERWNSGELPRRRVLPGAPEWTGDVAELINRARTGWDKAREALDRYL